jgi:hypothetical protein
MQNAISCLALGVSLLATACAEPDGTSQPSDGALTEIDSGAECAPGTEEFPIGETAGLTTTDAKTGLQVRVVWADHAPPIKERNTWTIAVTDAGGAPQSKAVVSWACAWMPAHLHGTNPQSIDPMGDGRFSVAKQNMAMYGGWQVKLWVSTDAAAVPYAPNTGSGVRSADACSPPDARNGTANIVFNVCVPRNRSGT